MLQRIDDALFDYVFQPIINRVQVVQPYEMATMSLAVFLGVLILKALYLYATQMLIERAVELGIDFAICLTLYGMSFHNVTPKTGRNPLRVSPFHMFMRVGGVVFGAYNTLHFFVEGVSFINSLRSVSDVIWIVYLYFEATDPPIPPATRFKIKPVLKTV